jgi:hypothetical protein
VFRPIVRTAFVLAVLFGAEAVRSEQLPEYQVKAEFIERFTRFIEWPQGASTGGPFVIGVIGTDPFRGYLDKMAADRKIKGRPVEIRRFRDIAAVDSCDIVFISSSERARLPAILARTDSHPILTVADSNGFAASGVLVNFYTSGDTVRFEMNETAIERSGLRVSAKLLKLARLVETEAMR